MWEKFEMNSIKILSFLETHIHFYIITYQSNIYRISPPW